MVWYYSRILQRTWLGTTMGNVPWLFPLFQTIHFLGIVLLVGIVAAVNLRMLGVAKGLPLRPLSRLLPWAMLGFAVTFMTGAWMYTGNPGQFQTWPFFAKMACVVLAGINGLHFYASGLNRQTNAVEAGHDVTIAAKLAAIASLAL